MPDLLVKLYELPELESYVRLLRVGGVSIRLAMAYEKLPVVTWVRDAFGDAWAGECDVAFANRPLSCFIAVENGAIGGFACYDTTCRDFFGPIGVAELWRRRGIGAALLLACLHSMRTLGYAYAVVGGAGDPEFYRRTVGATLIDGSSPGVYRDRLRP
jgi:GNAT superfamily N-acetyltransferase